MPFESPRARSRIPIPKYVGIENEYGNHLRNDPSEESGFRAAEALIHGGKRRSSDANDAWGKPEQLEFDRFGFRWYVDHGKAECSSPLVASAADAVRLQRKARRELHRRWRIAEKRVGPICVSFANTNRQGVAWGHHVNVLVSREAFARWSGADWAPLRKTYIPFVATCAPLFGTGKVGAENDAPDCRFQMSQRADFIDSLVGAETVASKSIINTRDEALADPEQYARFHQIWSDAPLCEFGLWLKLGVLQILLAMIEEQHPDIPQIELKDPLAAMKSVSRDLSFDRPVELAGGRTMKALEIQESFAEAAESAVESGSAAAGVPDAAQIVRLWRSTIDDLKRGDPKLARRLDWVAKLNFLRQAARGRPLDLETAKWADLRFSELGGAFERLERAGGFDRLEDFLPAAVGRRVRLVPRERCRAALLEKFKRHVVACDWSCAVLRGPEGDEWILALEDPFDTEGIENIIRTAWRWRRCFEALLERRLIERSAPEEIIVVLLDQQPEGGIEACEMQKS